MSPKLLIYRCPRTSGDVEVKDYHVSCCYQFSADGCRFKTGRCLASKAYDLFLAQSQPSYTSSVISAAIVSGRKISKRGYGCWTGIRSARDLR